MEFIGSKRFFKDFLYRKRRLFKYYVAQIFRFLTAKTLLSWNSPQKSEFRLLPFFQAFVTEFVRFLEAKIIQKTIISISSLFQSIRRRNQGLILLLPTLLHVNRLYECCQSFQHRISVKNRLNSQPKTSSKPFHLHSNSNLTSTHPKNLQIKNSIHTYGKKLINFSFSSLVFYILTIF